MNTFRRLIAIVLCQLLLAQGIAWAAPSHACQHHEAMADQSSMPCHHATAAAGEHDCCSSTAMSLDCDCGCDLAGSAVATLGTALSAQPPTRRLQALIPPAVAAAEPNFLLRPPRA